MQSKFCAIFAELIFAWTNSNEFMLSSTSCMNFLPDLSVNPSNGGTKLSCRTETSLDSF